MGVAGCHMINGKRGKLHLTIKRFWLAICKARPLWVMFLCACWGEVVTWIINCTFGSQATAPSPAWETKGFVEHSFKSTIGLRRLWSGPCSQAAAGTQASCNKRGIRACYLLTLLRTPFNDFAVIMNRLQGREVPPLNHGLIGQAGHLWIRNKEISLYLQQQKCNFFPFQPFVTVYTLTFFSDFSLSPPNGG